MKLACTCKHWYPPELKTSGEDACSKGNGNCYALQENGNSKYSSRYGPIDGPDNQPFGTGCPFRDSKLKSDADMCKYYSVSCNDAPSICRTTGSNTIDDFFHSVFNSNIGIKLAN